MTNLPTLTWTLESPGRIKQHVLTGTGPAAVHSYKILISPGNIIVLADDTEINSIAAYSHDDFNKFAEAYPQHVREMKAFCALHYTNRLPEKLKFDRTENYSQVHKLTNEVLRAPAGPQKNYEIAEMGYHYLAYLVTTTAKDVNYKRLGRCYSLEKAFALCNFHREQPEEFLPWWARLWPAARQTSSEVQ